MSLTAWYPWICPTRDEGEVGDDIEPPFAQVSGGIDSLSVIVAARSGLRPASLRLRSARDSDGEPSSPLVE